MHIYDPNKTTCAEAVKICGLRDELYRDPNKGQCAKLFQDDAEVFNGRVMDIFDFLKQNFQLTPVGTV